MTTLTDTQVITASGGLVELAYASTTTSIPTISGTSGGYANTTSIIPATTVVCDGSPVLVDFFCPQARCGSSATSNLVVCLFRDGSSVDVRYWGVHADAGTDVPMHLQYRDTPSAGSHTYEVRAYCTVSAGGMYSSTASGTTAPPIFLRVSKIVQATQWPAVTTGTIICTSSTRPAAPFEGQEIYETDTDLQQRWTGSAWVVSGSNGGSFLSASSTTTVSAASTITYTQASITLTPGVWEVQSAMTLINGTTTDSAAVAIYNQTAAAVVSGSYGTPGYTSTTWAAALQSMPTKMTVTSNTQVCPYGNRNGGSTILPAGGVGAPVGLITARRLYGG